MTRPFYLDYLLHILNEFSNRQHLLILFLLFSFASFVVATL